MGTRKDLEQGHRARSKGYQPRRRQGTLEVAGRRHAVAPRQQKVSQAFTFTHYKRQLENQVTEVIPPFTSLRDLEWDNVDRDRVRELRSHIGRRGSYDKAFRVQKILAQALDFVILEGWMRRNQNPAAKQKCEKSRHEPQHQPTIKWKQVPELLEAINLNRCSGHIQSVLALEFLLTTFLRAGALARLKWE